MKVTLSPSGKKITGRTMLKTVGTGAFLFFLIKGLVWLCVFIYLALSATN